VRGGISVTLKIVVNINFCFFMNQYNKVIFQPTLIEPILVLGIENWDN